MAEKRVVYLTFSTVGGKSTSVTISALVLELLYKMLKQRLTR